MKEKKIVWYENESIITNIIIFVLGLGIILGQVFFINSNNSFLSVINSIINKNLIYLLILIYFVFIKFKTGKKYFNYLNIFLVSIYFINSITSLLTCLQSFTLVSIITFFINITLLIYLSHSLFRSSRIYLELEINKSIFNEIKSINYFYTIIFSSIILLLVNLITVSDVNSVYLVLIEFSYFMLLARYISLYNKFIDERGDINV